MSEVKKISRGDFWMLDADEAWSHVNAIQKELDRLERVGHGMVERIIRVEGRGGNSLEAHYQDGRSQVFDFVDGEWAPRPSPNTRERTAREKNTALRDFICLNPNFDFGDASTVEEMLTRANISLTVTEE